MAKQDVELHDGIELSATEFQSRRSDVTFFVHSGGVVYLTVNGRRRMALVPVPVAEAYEHSKSAPAGGEDVPSSSINDAPAT